MRQPGPRFMLLIVSLLLLVVAGPLLSGASSPGLYTVAIVAAVASLLMSVVGNEITKLMHTLDPQPADHEDSGEPRRLAWITWPPVTACLVLGSTTLVMLAFAQLALTVVDDTVGHLVSSRELAISLTGRLKLMYTVAGILGFGFLLPTLHLVASGIGTRMRRPLPLWLCVATTTAAFAIVAVPNVVGDLVGPPAQKSTDAGLPLLYRAGLFLVFSLAFGAYCWLWARFGYWARRRRWA